MSRKHNTKHNRSKSTYSKKNKAARADRYGQYREGARLTADRLTPWTGDSES